MERRLRAGSETLPLLAAHCRTFHVEIENFVGTLADTVTLDIGKSLFQ